MSTLKLDIMDSEDFGDLEILLHAILNGGKEVTELLNKNCTDYAATDRQFPTVTDEVERFYEIVKNENEHLEGN